MALQGFELEYVVSRRLAPGPEHASRMPYLSEEPASPESELLGRPIRGASRERASGMPYQRSFSRARASLEELLSRSFECPLAKTSSPLPKLCPGLLALDAEALPRPPRPGLLAQVHTCQGLEPRPGLLAQVHTCQGLAFLALASSTFERTSEIRSALRLITLMAALATRLESTPLRGDGARIGSRLISHSSCCSHTAHSNATAVIQVAPLCL